MSDDRDIRPALSESEWERWLTKQHLPTYSYVTTAPSIGDDAARHQTAALCLHGKPFGFTANVPDFLRTICLSGQYEEHEAKAVREALDALADRIAALLPPREP